MKKKTVIIAAGALCLLAAGIRFGSQSFREPEPLEAPVYVLTYAENQPEDYPTTKGARKFAELVEERTDGRIQILVFSDGELGDELSVFRQVQYGGIDFARLSVMTLSEFVPEMNVLQLPYLYRDEEHMWRVLDGDLGEEFLGTLESCSVVGLSWYGAGARHFYNSVKPIERLEDLRGMRIRVAESELMKGMVSALHATPVTMAYSEVYEALAVGSIDGAENNWPSYEAMKHYQVAKYITLDGHNRIPEVQMISQATWEKLSEEDRKVIRECAVESALYQREEWEKEEKAAEERLRAAGCVVTELDEKELIRFRMTIMPLYQTYCGEYIDLINRIAQE